ncbi:hypothetical protein OT109_06500 [Phycisphaeraceae bacterium D3-23]
MPRPIKPAPRFWWWPRLSVGFVVLYLALAGAFLLIQAYRLDFGTYFLMACLWLPMGLLFRQRARLAKRVLMRAGVTCPCCLRELEEESPCCTHCEAGHTRSVYVDYWTMVSATPALAERWWRSMNKAEDVKGRATHLTIAGRWQIGLLVAFVGLVFIGTVVLRPASLLGMDLLWILPVYLGMGGGLWLNYTHGSRRVGSSLHCAECDYQIDPTRLSMDTCPECGSGLTGHDQTAVGRRVGHRGFTFLGYGMIALPLALILLPILGGPFFKKLSPSNYLPVSLYVDDATNGTPDYRTWRVLESRYAQAADVQRLADALVLQMQDDTDDDLSYAFGMDKALAFQLDGPNASDAVKLEVAHAMILNQDQRWRHKLTDWLESYLQSLTPNSAEKQSLLAAAEQSFHAGALDYRLRFWLESQRGHTFRIHNEMGRFCQDLLTFEVKQYAQGNNLVIRTNPHIALSPGLWPDLPTAVYVLVVPPDDPPGVGPADRAAPSTLRYDPFEYLGQAHTLATIPIDESYPDALRYRLRFVVFVGEVELPARFVQWHSGWPMLPGNVVPEDEYGPMELAPGWPSARDTTQRPRRGGR